MSCKRGAVLLAGGYVVLVGVLVVALFRGITWNPPPLKQVAYVAGCVAYVLLCCQFLLSARLRWLDRWVSQDRLFLLHGALAVVALVVVWTHGILVTWGSEKESSLREAGEIARLFFLLTTLGGAILLGTVGLERVPGFVALRRGVRRVFHLRYHWCVWLHNFAVVAATVMLVHVLLLHAPTLVPFKVVCVLLYAACVGTHLYQRLLRWRLLPLWRCTASATPGEAIRRLCFTPEAGSGLSFAPGQFAYLSVDSRGLREPHPFTIAGARNGELEFDIKGVGDWTRELATVTTGSCARLHGPFGAFTAQGLDPDRPLLLLAGGIGITPFLAMVRDLAAAGSDRQVRLVWSVTREQDAFARHELDELACRLPHLHVAVRVTGVQGVLDQAALVGLLGGADLPRTEAFLCGPPPFMAAMARILRGLGLPKGQVHQERFGY